jgi:hypothetical protein
MDKANDASCGASRDSATPPLTSVDLLTGQNHWEAHADRFLVPAAEQYIVETKAQTRTFLAEKSDVLIWHGRLMHRGTVPSNRNAIRRALITHYSGIGHRSDMPQRSQDATGYADPDVPEPAVGPQ